MPGVVTSEASQVVQLSPVSSVTVNYSASSADVPHLTQRKRRGCIGWVTKLREWFEFMPLRRKRRGYACYVRFGGLTVLIYSEVTAANAPASRCVRKPSSHHGLSQDGGHAAKSHEMEHYSTFAILPLIATEFESLSERP